METLSDYPISLYKVCVDASGNEDFLLLLSYIGDFEDGPKYDLNKITDKKYIDLFLSDGESTLLNKLNNEEFTKLITYLDKQNSTVKAYRKKGANVLAQSIINSLSVPKFWIQKLTDWFVENAFDIPVFNVIELYKYEEFEIFFKDFYNDKESDPIKVKSVLNDRSIWSNPSKYLSDARKSVGITVAELKKRPGFDWIDPKGTAHD